MRNRRANIMHFAKTINFHVSHIFCEENVLVDRLANISLQHHRSLELIQWLQIPIEYHKQFHHYSLGFPNYRFA